MSQPSTSDYWSNHSPTDYSSLPGFLTTEEVDELIELGTVVEIEAVRESEGKFGPMFTADIRVGSEVRSKSFSIGAIPGRDVMLRDVREHLEGGGNAVPVVLQRWGAGVGLAAPPPATEDSPWPSEEPPEEVET